MKLIPILFAATITCYGGSINSLTVDATADIYSAGHAALPDTNYPGTFAPAVNFDPDSDQILTFSSVTGAVGCNFAITNGPDGGCAPGINTTVSSYGGLSGISVFGSNMFLVGVFLAQTEPSGAGPAVLSYNFGSAGLSTEDTTYQPALDQVFFIGDGLTGTGQQQQFYVPGQASRLFLGFADSFDGAPSFYGDNVGSLYASLQIGPSAPEPSTFLLLTAALILSVVLRRRHLLPDTFAPGPGRPRVTARSSC